MDYPIHIDAISMKYSSPLCILRGCQPNFLYKDYEKFRNWRQCPTTFEKRVDISKNSGTQENDFEPKKS